MAYIYHIFFLNYDYEVFLELIGSFLWEYALKSTRIFEKITYSLYDIGYPVPVSKKYNLEKRYRGL